MERHHASFVDAANLAADGPRGEAALDTRHLLGALGELASRQSAGEPVLWQLRPRVPSSETDAESLAGFTPAFTPSASTPREPHAVADKPAAASGGRWERDAGRGFDAGQPPPARDTAQRYSGSQAAPAPLRDAAKRHRSTCPHLRTSHTRARAKARPSSPPRAALSVAPALRAGKGFADIAESRGDSAVDADDESEGDDASDDSAGSDDDTDASDSCSDDDDAVLRAITRGRELLVGLLPSLVGFGIALLLSGALGPLLSGNRRQGARRGVRRPLPPPAAAVRQRRQPPPPPPPPKEQRRGAAPPPPPEEYSDEEEDD